MLLVNKEDYSIDYCNQNDDKTSENKIYDIKSLINSTIVTDSEKMNTNTSSTVNFLETLEKSIYERHIEVILPLKAMFEVRNAAYPIQILDEINSAFVHLSKYKLNGTESDLKHAFSHMAYAEIYAYKSLCTLIEDKYDTLIYNRKRSILKKEIIPHTLMHQNENAKRTFQYAIEREMQGMDINELLVLYKNALNNYMELDNVIDRCVESMI